MFNMFIFNKGQYHLVSFRNLGEKEKVHMMLIWENVKDMVFQVPTDTFTQSYKRLIVDNFIVGIKWFIMVD